MRSVDSPRPPLRLPLGRMAVDHIRSRDELLGAGAVSLATIGYAAGALIVRRRLSDTAPLGPVSVAMARASILLLPLGVADFPARAPSAEAVASLLVLGLARSALAFIIFLALIAEAGVSRATVITYANPAVALALGAAILGEAVTATAVGGLLLVIAGSWLTTDGRLPRLVSRTTGTRLGDARPQELR